MAREKNLRNIRLEKQRYNQKDDGTISRNQKVILDKQNRYYQRLYMSDHNVEFFFVNNGDIKLTDAEEMDCDREISLKELTKSVKSMQVGKSPGCDGLGPEYFSAFWDKIGPILHKVIKHAIEEKILTRSMRRGIISIIPKKTKDQKYIKNWRPLTLLNTDYKVVAKVLIAHTKPHLDKLIHLSQTEFMSGRNIAN